MRWQVLHHAGRGPVCTFQREQVQGILTIAVFPSDILGGEFEDKLFGSHSRAILTAKMEESSGLMAAGGDLGAAEWWVVV